MLPSSPAARLDGSLALAANHPEATNVVRAASARPSRQVWVVMAMLFLLTAANGRPYWWSSAPPVTLLALLLIGWRGIGTVLKQLHSKINAPIFLLLLLTTAWTALSALANFDGETMTTLTLRCVIPLLIYCSVAGLSLNRNDERFCLFAIVAGSSLPLVSGILVFYRDFGLPDLKGLLYDRYDVAGMLPYMEATFGNVSHVGMYILLIAPAVVVAMTTGLSKKVSAVVFTAWLAVIACSVIITGSRTALVVILVVSGFLIGMIRRSRALVVAAVVLAGAAAFLSSVDSWDRGLLIDRFAPSMGTAGRDGSVEERLESIEIGWDTLQRHLAFGIGPGKSSDYNIHDVPHQSALFVASETGLFGGLAFLLLNAVVIFRTLRHAARARRHEVDRRRLLWIVGPASWLLGGLFAGLTFNMNITLLWIGITHVMLGLYGFQE